MSFFELELSKILAYVPSATEVTYAGDSAYIPLSGQRLAKVYFAELGTYHKYEGVAVAILHRTNGLLDKTIFRFSNILGTKSVDNPNFKQGLVPYVWIYEETPEWYCYQPTPQDYKALAAAIEPYIALFNKEEQ